MRNVTLAALIAVAVAMAEVGSLAKPLPAFAACDPGRPQAPGGWVATKAFISGITGVSALIRQYSPYYSGQSPTGTNATIMMANQTIDHWVQFGWFKSELRGGVVHRESGLEFKSATQNEFNWFGSQPVGTNTWYEVLQRQGLNTYDFYIEGALVDTWTGSIGQTHYQMFGEITDFQDQMPGARLNPVTFKNSNYFTGYYNPHIMTSAPDPGTDYWKMTHPSSGRYDIWDEACAT